MQELLQTFGAILTENGEVRFANEPADLGALDQSTVLVPLAQYGVIGIEGPDSAKFLQGQVTCDTLAVTATQSTPGAYCTPKGRMLASFHLAQPGQDHYWLRLRRDIVAGTLQTLGKYAVFSKAKLQAREDIVALGLHGPDAAAVVASLTPQPPAGRYGAATLANGLVVQLDDAAQWFEIWLPASDAATVWQNHAPRLTPAGTRYWQALLIRAGRGEVCAATVDTFIPQMLNLDLTGAISFKKGCYTGQEIVARAHYRGQVKRHMRRFAVNAQAPAAGADVNKDNGQKAGNIVNSVSIDAQRAELLAVIADGAWEEGAIQLTDGASLQPLELPYAIT